MKEKFRTIVIRESLNGWIVNDQFDVNITRSYCFQNNDSMIEFLKGFVERRLPDEIIDNIMGITENIRQIKPKTERKRK